MDETAPTVGMAGGPIASSNVRHLAKIDVGGAGQVTIDGAYAYLGYMYGPEGTSIVDISDPRKPKVVSTIMLDCPQSHSHKVRVIGDIMIVNSEQRPVTRDPYEDGGFRIYDISDKTNPKLIHFERTHGKGVHRFDADETYAYISTEMEGFVGNILVIYDIRNPAKPREVGRWWMPGQNVAAGETPSDKGAQHRLHHALRHENRFYAGCWMSGFAIIDGSDLARPRTLCHYDVHPQAAEPSHTLLRVPFPVGGRAIALGTDEERKNRGDDAGKPHAPLYVFDVTDPTDMKLIHTHHVPESASPYNGPKVRFGAHQLNERMTDTRAHLTWFAAGLRIIDIADPEQPREVGYFIPEPGKGHSAPQTNDVALDDRGLIYITDKDRGFDVIEFSG
ncbi:MAG TPA: RNA polymerase subunit sigma-70 [Alphaproteobacteria bacterium]